MNTTFKIEFEKLNPNEIKEIVNRCAGHDILEIDALKDVFQNNEVCLPLVGKLEVYFISILITHHHIQLLYKEYVTLMIYSSPSFESLILQIPIDHIDFQTKLLHSYYLN